LTVRRRHRHQSFVLGHGVLISRVLAEARRPPFDLTHAGGQPRRKMRTRRCSQINTAQPAPAIDADDYLKLLMRLAGTLNGTNTTRLRAIFPKFM
jgi:hypothetical protein